MTGVLVRHTIFVYGTMYLARKAGNLPLNFFSPHLHTPSNLSTFLIFPPHFHHGMISNRYTI